MATYKVYVTDARHENYTIEREMLAAIDAELIVCQCVTEEDIIRECADADGIILDMAPMTEKVINGLRHCKVIARYGVGYDNVDVDACTQKGIWVTNVPDYCSEEVASHALALLLTCLRQTALRDREVRKGKWNICGTSFRLSGKVLGVLGFGRIARSLVKQCSGFGFSKVLVYDPYISAETIADMGAQKVELDEVLRECDFLSLHMPATSQTIGMINKETLALMKPNAILVNTGRGSLINDHDLIDALKSRRIHAAGLDTHGIEPLPMDSGYRQLDNVVLTDHYAYSSVESVVDMKTKAAQNVINVLIGTVPAYPVNKL